MRLRKRLYRPWTSGKDIMRLSIDLRASINHRRHNFNMSNSRTLISRPYYPFKRRLS